MTAAQAKNTALGAGVAVVLTFLFIQQRPVDPRQHDRFMSDLQRIKRLDAEINRDLLSSRYELLSSYDPFVRQIKEMREAGSDLRRIAPIITGRGNEQIEQSLKRESEVVARKAYLIERFKSDNAILRNSLRYFPVLIAEASGAAVNAGDRQLQIILRTCCGISFSTTSRPIPV